MLRLTPREGPAAAPRFRTFQVCPKDLPAAPRQAERAVSRASGPVATTPDDRGGSPKFGMKRREFITLLGGAAATWPRAARAQLAMPAIGFLDSRLPDAITDRLRGFREGLKDTGYVEGENVAIVYRLAENQDARLPELAGDLVRRRVAVICAGGTPSTFAAQAATKTIPIVFLVGDDPVRLGLVTSLSRPGGNMTGINVFNSEVTAKRLELLRELVPKLGRIAVLVNPADATLTETQLKCVNAAAGAMGLQF